jgi:hypothetical protein
LTTESTQKPAAAFFVILPAGRRVFGSRRPAVLFSADDPVPVRRSMLEFFATRMAMSPEEIQKDRL